MAKRDETVCDACVDEGKDEIGRPVYLGFAQAWWMLDLCEDHEIALLGDLVTLLDTVGAPAQGPALDVEGV